VIYNRRDDNPWQRDLYAFLGRVGGDPGVASPELAIDRDGDPPARSSSATNFWIWCATTS
jgi:hypothetical protein